MTTGSEAAHMGRLDPQVADEILLDVHLTREPRAGWEHSARCATMDPNVFYPETGGPAGAAKRVCASCPVQADCRTQSITAGEAFGVWGGLSREERLPIIAAYRRQQKRIARAS